MNIRSLVYFLIILISFSSCESEAERKEREALREQEKKELKQARAEEERKAEIQAAFQEAEREEREKAELLAREARLENERREKAIYDKFINNSLRTGSTPYSYCYGNNSSCSAYGCSQIKVRTPNNSDVLVIIKKGSEVVRHAYINAGNTYTFELPNGAYQPFFYYGKGWNPDKLMKQVDCGPLKGGFISDEHFGKDSPQSLANNVLTYELILQQSGNFSTRPSNASEAL